jgi:acyl-CoA reductase-like NAD-dependent aldehyde dehydrogenase
MAYETRLFINGKFVDPQSGQSFDLKNPATGDVVAKVLGLNLFPLASVALIRGYRYLLPSTRM